MQLPSLDEVTLFKAADFVLFFAIHGDFYNGSFVHRNKQANWNCREGTFVSVRPGSQKPSGVISLVSIVTTTELIKFVMFIFMNNDKIKCTRYNAKRIFVREMNV